MSYTRTMHVRPLSGCMCRNPLPRHYNAANLKAGEVLSIGGYEIKWYDRIKAYGVTPEHTTQPFYKFSNFTCAMAKLAELGGYHANR